MVDRCPLHSHPMPMDEEYWHDPHAAYARMRAAGPIHRICLPDGIPVWFVTDYQHVHAGLRDQRLARPRKYAGPDYTNTLPPEGLADSRLVMEDPPEQTQTRRLVNFAFRENRVAEIIPRIEEIIGKLLDDTEEAAAANGGEVDLVQTYFAPLSISVIGEILGIPAQDFDLVRIAGDSAIAPAEGDDPAVLNGLIKVMIQLIENRRREPTDDLISYWATTREKNDEPLSTHDILIMTSIIFFGGFDSSVGALSLSTLDLLGHPEQLAKLRANPELYPAAVEELLRRHSTVVRGFRRFAREDLEIAGQRISAGDTVLLSINAANRDPQVFPDPQALDFDRPENSKHIGFGRGPHYCPGHVLVRAELAVALRTLLERFENLELAVPQQDIDWRRSTFVRTPRGLPVRL